MIPGGSNSKRLTDADSIGTTSLICAYIGQPLVIATSDGVAALVSWLIYECSDTVEQSMIPGGSNNERLTVIDTRNCYTSLPARLSCVHLHMP